MNCRSTGLVRYLVVYYDRGVYVALVSGMLLFWADFFSALSVSAKIKHRGR